MIPRDFDLSGKKFKLSKIDAIKQFHLVRKLAPLLGEIAPIAKKLSKIKADAIGPEQFEVFMPIINAIAKLSDEDAENVLMALLSSVEMQQQPSGAWAYVARDNILMFHDLELPVLLQIAARAFGYNCSGFLAANP